MRVGVERNKYEIRLPLPPRIDPSVTMMTVEEKPDVTYGDVGGCKEQIEKLREVVELPLLSPERFVKLGIDPPKGILLYGPPVLVRHCVLEQLPTEPMPLLSELLVRNLFKSMLVKVLVWLENF